MRCVWSHWTAGSGHASLIEVTAFTKGCGRSGRLSGLPPNRIKTPHSLVAAWAMQDRQRHASSGPTDSGAQIDLLIDRKDDVINVCEMKYTVSPFSIDKGYADELRRKLEVFKAVTGTRKSLFLTMVTTEGVIPNNYRSELVINEVNASALFAQ